MEVRDRYRAELDAKFMQVVDMGFDPVEVRKVMKIYGSDPDMVVFVLTEVGKELTHHCLFYFYWYIIYLVFSTR